MTVQEAFKRFRKEKNISQSELAATLGLTQTSYNYEKTSRKANPSAEVLIKIADTYDVSIDYLLGRTDDPRPLKIEKQAVVSENEPADDIQTLKADNQFLKEQLAKLAEKVDKLTS